MEPPGCITLAIPFLCAISTQSGKGKKGSLAITDPFRSTLKDKALLMACSRASTLEVCPVPLAHYCLFFSNTIVLDFVCLQSLEAKIRSSTSLSERFLFVTYVKSASVSVLLSLSWTRIPLRQLRTEFWGSSTSFRIR